VILLGHWLPDRRRRIGHGQTSLGNGRLVKQPRTGVNTTAIAGLLQRLSLGWRSSQSDRVGAAKRTGATGARNLHLREDADALPAISDLGEVLREAQETGSGAPSPRAGNIRRSEDRLRGSSINAKPASSSSRRSASRRLRRPVLFAADRRVERHRPVRPPPVWRPSSTSFGAELRGIARALVDGRGSGRWRPRSRLRGPSMTLRARSCAPRSTCNAHPVVAEIALQLAHDRRAPAKRREPANPRSGSKPLNRLD